MSANHYHLIAVVGTDNPNGVHSILRDFIAGKGIIKEVEIKEMTHGKDGEFFVQADLEGETSKELNNKLLSALRKVESRTSLRSAWNSGKVTEHYFDYVLKKVTEL
jgi:hypothetical protein